MDTMKVSDFMVYHTFYESIKRLIDAGRRDAAEALAYEIVKYGTTGSRSQIFEDCGLEARMRSFIPYIDKSKQNCMATIVRKKQRQSEKYAVKEKQSPAQKNTVSGQK